MGDDYEYWADGSLKKDRNKKIASITYNFLKRPEIITFDNGRTITTEYDADGTKLKKIDSNGEVTDYEEDDIYVNGILYQTSHDEGRIANGVYEYNITDHNNDLRVSFRDSLGIAVPTQSIFYDPWGLSMKGMQITRNPTNFNKYQFLNRETQFETGYIDLINRQFDPQTGRFVSQDPVTDGQEHLSLYQYGWNNPVLKSDANGDCPFCPAIPFLPEIGAGLVVAGEAIAGLFVGGATGTAIGMAGSSDGNAMIPYNVQLYAKKVEAEMGQSGQSQGKGRGAEGANNKKKGDEFEKKVTEKLKQDGHTDVAEQITVKPNPDPGGQTPKKVKLDNVSQKDGKTKLTDAKSSETAPNTQNQKDGYPLIERNGGTVTGKGAAKKGYREGTKIPPTKVDIIRPKDL